MPNLITIWSFSYQHQMLIIRGRLESEGIESYTQDELTIQVDPLYSNALGGIKLMVREEDAERATEILAEAGYVKKADNQTKIFYSGFTGLRAICLCCETSVLNDGCLFWWVLA